MTILFKITVSEANPTDTDLLVVDSVNGPVRLKRGESLEEFAYEGREFHLSAVYSGPVKESEDS